MKEKDPLIQVSPLDLRDGAPWSDRFGDIYFSRDGGEAECRHVFLNANGLPERWASSNQQHFVIGETGFGTGLNFLSTWKLWQEAAPDTGELIYISTEKFPFQPEDLLKLYADSPFLSLAHELVRKFPPLLPGFHKIRFHESRISLMLLLGDTAEMLSRLDAPIDAWFLDGFSPSKNPDMWNESVFEHISRLSKPGTTLSSFSCAGAVRRALAASGFQVLKIPGFGQKREMIRAEFISAPKADKQHPWFSPAAPLEKSPSNYTISIIGAGIAGCATAWRLQQSGFECTVIDAEESPANGASGNPAGIIRPKSAHLLHAPDSFPAAAWTNAVTHLNSLSEDGLWKRSGVMDRGDSTTNELSESDSWLSALMPSLNHKVHQNDPERRWLCYQEAGWIQPAPLCNHLLRESRAAFIPGRIITDLIRDEGKWRLLDGDNNCVATSDIVIFTTGYQSTLLNRYGAWPLKPVAGQVSSIKIMPCDKPQHVYCEQGYLTPGPDNLLIFGATYRKGANLTEITAEDTEENLEYLESLSPTLRDLCNTDEINNRVSIRGQTSDYQPLVGPIPDFLWAQTHYAGLSMGKRGPYSPMQHLPGLYMNVGHGSRGFANAFLCADILACELTGQPAPLPMKVMHSISPARFLIRDIRRKRKVGAPATDAAKPSY